MFSKIKHKFKKLGFISIELVILASVMLTAGGYGVAKLGGNASGATKNENDLFNSLFGKEDEELPDYVVNIKDGIQTIKANGEVNLTADDIVEINGVKCYVYKIKDDKALLITKDMYNVRFDDANYNKGNKTNIGTESYANLTYDYSQSYLKKWMEEFYITQLGADSRILPTTVTYYTSDVSTSDLNSYATGTIADQYVFALDAKEAKQYASKFKWDNKIRLINDNGSSSGYYSNFFWTTAGFSSNNGNSNPWRVSYNGGFSNYYDGSTGNGARPVFWISLD